YPRRVSPFGHPRIKAWLAAPRGLSQLPTSFIASRHLGIRRTPFPAWSSSSSHTRAAPNTGLRPASSLLPRLTYFRVRSTRSSLRLPPSPSVFGARTLCETSRWIRSHPRPGWKGSPIWACVHIRCDLLFPSYAIVRERSDPHRGNLVELDGIEPTTSCLQSRRSTY